MLKIDQMVSKLQAAGLSASDANKFRRNAKPRAVQRMDERESPSKLLIDCFEWSKSPEGFEFWAALYNRMGDGAMSPADALEQME